MKLTNVISAAALAFALCGAAWAQDKPTSELGPVDVASTVTELADILEQTYVFPDIGRRYGARLRGNLAAGAYDGAADAQTLAAALDADLRAVQPDGHLRVQVARQDRRGPEPSSRDDSPFGDGAWFRNGVAYLPITGLPQDADSQARMADLLDSYAGARALILDLRTCYGGGLAVMDVLFSRLYATRTHLVTMETRAGVDPDFEARLDSMASLERIGAPEGLRRWRHWAQPASSRPALADAHVYVLTGHTASACEHLALALKRTGRATLIGGQTMGAGHFGGLQRFGGLEAFVGIGRTYDPDTGEGWEGGGVTPDVATPPDEAMAYALSQLGASDQASSSTSQ